MKITLYLLQGPYPQYYCGKAKVLARRIQEHRTGHGSAATQSWKTFEVLKTVEVEVKNESEACFAELAWANQNRKELPGMMVYGPGDHRQAGYNSKKRKRSNGPTYSF